MSYTLPYKLTHRISVSVNIILSGYPEHSPRDKNNLEAWIPIGQTSVAQVLPV
jgi:hypothetical protein